MNCYLFPALHSVARAALLTYLISYLPFRINTYGIIPYPLVIITLSAAFDWCLVTQSLSIHSLNIFINSMSSHHDYLTVIVYYYYCDCCYYIRSNFDFSTCRAGAAGGRASLWRSFRSYCYFLLVVNQYFMATISPGWFQLLVLGFIKVKAVTFHCSDVDISSGLTWHF